MSGRESKTDIEGDGNQANVEGEDGAATDTNDLRLVSSSWQPVLSPEPPIVVLRTYIWNVVHRALSQDLKEHHDGSVCDSSHNDECDLVKKIRNYFLEGTNAWKVKKANFE